MSADADAADPGGVVTTTCTYPPSTLLTGDTMTMWALFQLLVGLAKSHHKDVQGQVYQIYYGDRYLILPTRK